MLTPLELTPFQEIIFYIGSLGIFIGVVFGILRLRKAEKRDASKKASSLGIKSHESLPLTKGHNNKWWSALEKTRNRFAIGFDKDIPLIKEQLEEACLITDMGIANTTELLSSINWKDLSGMEASKRESLAKSQMSELVKAWLSKNETSNHWPQKKSNPTVIWFVGTNGVGKTTTIAKLAKELKDQNHSVMLAAGDTFRAAASEQLETWAQRLEIPCVRGKEGADSSAILFDAIESAKSKNIDFVLCDSAGRLHNNTQLMDNLAKNKRVMSKALEGAPHETVLVLDANTGQNMLNQAKTYTKDIGIDALILTKLDGTARGGALIAVVRETGIPIRRLGLGEKPEDFKTFDTKSFAESLFG